MAARWWPLAVVSAGAFGLAAGGVLPRWPGLVHAVALPPLDLALDVRLLVARAPTYPAFLVGLGASAVVRTAVLGSLLVALGTTSLGGAMARAARLYVAALVPMTVAAALEFAGLAAVYAWYGWVGLVLMLLTAVTLATRWLPPRGVRLRRSATVLGYVLALAALGSVARLVGSWGALIGVVLSALLTAVMLARMVGPPPRRRAPRWRAFRREASMAAVLLTLAATPTAVAPQPVDPGSALLVVPGVDTSSGHGAAYRLDPAALGFPCERVFYFSYRGPGQGAPAGEASCPIRLHLQYGEESTQRPIGELADAFAEQVVAIRAEIGDAPLVVVTHSQGAVIAWRAVADGRVDGVSHLVALGGFSHSPVGYPPPGEDGIGRVGADALRVLSWVSRFLEFGTFDPDAPLAREVLARPDGLELVFGKPLPSGVTAALLFATADLIAAPEGHVVPGALTSTLDTTHVRIIESGGAEAKIRQILAGRPPGGETPLAAVLDATLPAFLPPPAEPAPSAVGSP
jgi:pimeloyl-ACP methyl ester carboxylesterase